ncbi:MAG: hypothetical protein Kow0069_37020 [Promethearchaeota archaeon]
MRYSSSLGGVGAETRLRELLVAKLARQETRYEVIKERLAAIEVEVKQLKVQVQNSFRALLNRKLGRGGNATGHAGEFLEEMAGDLPEAAKRLLEAIRPALMKVPEKELRANLSKLRVLLENLPIDQHEAFLAKFREEMAKRGVS